MTVIYLNVKSCIFYTMGKNALILIFKQTKAQTLLARLDTIQIKMTKMKYKAYLALYYNSLS